MAHAAEGFVKILENIERQAVVLRQGQPQAALVVTLVERLVGGMGEADVPRSADLAVRWMLTQGYSELFREQGKRLIYAAMKLCPGYFCSMHWVQSILRSGYPLCNIYDFFAAAPSEIVFADRGVASMLNNAAMMVFQKSTGGTLQIGCSACKLLSVLPAHTFAVTAIAELPVKLVEWASIEMQLQNGERVAAEAALAHHVEKIVVGLLQKCWSLAQSPEQAAVSSGVAALHAGLREETLDPRAGCTDGV